MMLHRSAILAAILLSTLGLTSSVAVAQPSRPSAASPATSVNIQVRAVKIAPALRAALQAKPKLDPAKLSAFRRDADGPIVKVKSGREYRLLEAEDTTKKSTRAVATLPQPCLLYTSRCV